jgi:hypothetical protein
MYATDLDAVQLRAELEHDELSLIAGHGRIHRPIHAISALHRYLLTRCTTPPYQVSATQRDS